MKRLNQTMLPLMAACLLSVTPAWAADQMSGNAANPAATAKVKQQELPPEVQKSLDLLIAEIPDLQNYRMKHSEYREKSYRDYHSPVWSISLTNQPANNEKGSKNEFASARIQFDAKTGRLLSLDIRNPAWASSNYPDPKLAREKADTFIHAMLGTPFKAAQTLVRGKSGSEDENGKKLAWAYLTVRYSPLINDIPLLNDTISVSVDAAGNVVEYDAYDYADPTLVTWPDPKDALPLEKARAIFTEQLEMKLLFDSNQPIAYDQSGRISERKPMLMYIPETPYRIEAHTGKALDTFSEPAEETVKVKGEGQTVKITSREEAEKWLKERFGIDVANTAYEYNDHKDNIEEGLQQIESYDWFNINDLPQLPYEAVSITTDAQSDLLIDFDLELPESRKADSKISVSEAKKKAIEALEDFLDPSLTELQLHVPSDEEPIPDWVDVSKLEKEEKKEQNYSFNFRVKRSGVDVDNEFYDVGIDQVSGAVTKLNLHPLKPGTTIPDMSKIVSAQAAEETFKNEIDAELVYIWEEYQNQRAPKPKLVYQRKLKTGYSFIDATTGQLFRVNRP